MRREGGDIGLFYNNVLLFVGLTTLGTLNLILISWFIKLSVQMFQPLILVYGRKNFVYNHWACISIYRPLSYPFRSLDYMCAFFKAGIGYCCRIKRFFAV